MFLYVLRTILVIAAGCVLFVLYRRLERVSRPAGRVVAVGILLRAVGGQVLFWISYLHLPVFQRLQLGDGFWWFGSDSSYYYSRAAEAAHHGWRAIIFLNRTDPSVSYIQILATAIVLFGTAVSVGLLLNLLAYVISCILVVRLASHRSLAMLAAVAALSFAPSAVLWATQPLKDVVCWMLIIAVVAATAEWAAAWSRSDTELWRRLLVVALLCAALFGLAGIRWYFALTLLIASLPLFGITALHAERRWRVSAGAAATVVVAFYAFLFGAGPYAPTPIREVAFPRTALAGSRSLPASIAAQLQASREGNRGATTISIGPTLTGLGRSVAGTLPEPGPGPRPAGSTEKAVANQSLIKVGRRLFVGMIAIFIPRFVAQRLGLIEIGRGTGMAFVELDTLFFDAVVAFCVFSIARHTRKRGWSRPLFWLLLVTTAVLTLAIAYVETNLGTLMRLRGMLLVSFILLLIASDVPAEAPAAAQRQDVPQREVQLSRP